ncbi:hypothetical protein OSB04_013037 [Centaurea solstitialis]|uniref:Uncharacterized protein n=1 Tax=Centaurea solstitialis TaxID=347529 RepID=A0AA38TK11_9ASTR|nr:hypothetical protein OSB04_013037 [Centaurea solstitialis]
MKRRERNEREGGVGWGEVGCQFWSLPIGLGGVADGTDWQKGFADGYTAAAADGLRMNLRESLEFYNLRNSLFFDLNGYWKFSSNDSRSSEVHVDGPQSGYWKFDGSNYTRWADKVKFMLMVLNLAYVMDVNLKRLLRKEAENLACGHIKSALSDRLYDLYAPITYPRELWKALNKNIRHKKKAPTNILCRNI